MLAAALSQPIPRGNSSARRGPETMRTSSQPIRATGVRLVSDTSDVASRKQSPAHQKNCPAVNQDIPEFSERKCVPSKITRDSTGVALPQSVQLVRRSISFLIGSECRNGRDDLLDIRIGWLNAGRDASTASPVVRIRVGRRSALFSPWGAPRSRGTIWVAHSPSTQELWMAKHDSGLCAGGLRSTARARDTGQLGEPGHFLKVSTRGAWVPFELMRTQTSDRVRAELHPWVTRVVVP